MSIFKIYSGEQSPFESGPSENNEPTGILSGTPLPQGTYASGTLFYNTNTGILSVFEGGSWIPTSSGGGSGTGTTGPTGADLILNIKY
jgi:hypothetical protein